MTARTGYAAMAANAARVLAKSGTLNCYAVRRQATTTDATKPWNRDSGAPDIVVASGFTMLMDHLEQWSGRQPGALEALTQGTTAVGYADPNVVGILAGDVVTVGNDRYVVLWVKPVNPGGTLLLNELHLKG